MPRERIDDPDTEGLYVQVNWRAHDDDDTHDPGHVQISIHDERQDARVFELLDEAHDLIGMLTSVIRSGEADSETTQEARQKWRAKLDEFRAELTGTYVTLTPETIKPLLRTIHKAERQAWPRAVDPGSAAELAITGPPSLPVPGASGYPLVQRGGHLGVPDPALTLLDLDPHE
jgi:hypothetical protein